MKASELRIGNWVNAAWGDFEIGVINPNFENWHELNPIQLTEDWFVKFGYEHSTAALADLYELSFEYLGFNLVINADDFYDMWNKMHVHTFQNWWRANTGEELKTQTKVL